MKNVYQNGNKINCNSIRMSKYCMKMKYLSPSKNKKTETHFLVEHPYFWKDKKDGIKSEKDDPWLLHSISISIGNMD